MQLQVSLHFKNKSEYFSCPFVYYITIPFKINRSNRSNFYWNVKIKFAFGVFQFIYLFILRFLAEPQTT